MKIGNMALALAAFLFILAICAVLLMACVYGTLILFKSPYLILLALTGEEPTWRIVALVIMLIPASLGLYIAFCERGFSLKRWVSFIENFQYRQALQSDSPDIQIDAIHCLAGSCSRTDRRMLQRALNSRHPNVANAAAHALDKG